MKNRNDNWYPVASGDYDGYVHSTHPPAAKRKKILLVDLIIALLAVTAVVLLMMNTFQCSVFGGQKKPAVSGDTGYYSYKDTTLYNQNGIWYEYDTALGWVLADPSEDFLENYNTYYDNSAYPEKEGVADFRGSGFYQEPDANHSSQGENSQSVLEFDEDTDNDWQ